MICPSCGTWNRDEAFFCKYCGFDLSKVPRPVTPPPAPAAPPPPAPAAPLPPTLFAPRAWWHGIGVFVILATFFVFIDLATNRRITWSVVGILALAFLAGGIMILQFLASPDRRDRRPFLAGAALLASALFLLPVTLAIQSAPTTTESFQVPFSASVRTIDLTVTDDAGQVTVQFVATAAYLVHADVTHVGGLFSSHYEGDVTQANATTNGGTALTFTLAAHGFGGLFFVGGHDIVVSVQRDLSVAMTLESTTGSVSVSVPSAVVVRSIAATVTTGGVTVGTQDANLADAAIRATSTTGGVTVDLRQPTVHAGTVDVVATTTTGGVTFLFRPGSGVGAQISSHTTTGGINFDGQYYQGTTALLWAPSQSAYNAAEMTFSVQLTTTTGGIDIR